MKAIHQKLGPVLGLAALAGLLTLGIACDVPEAEEGSESTNAYADEARNTHDHARSVTVPEGRLLSVRFADTLSSATSASGDRFQAELTEPVMVDGSVAIPAGSTVSGTVVAVNKADRFGGKASLDLEFDTLEVGDQRVPISAALYSEERGEKKKDAARIGGGIIGGAIIGRVLDDENGVEEGAAAGAIAGTVIAAMTKGDEVQIPVGAQAHLRLSRSVTL